MKIFKILIIAFVFAGCISCDKEEENQYLIGDIVGFVNLRKFDGNEPENKSGVKVSIENTEYSCTTNKIGRYEFNDIPAGTYNIVYEYDGYATSKNYGVQFVGGNNPFFNSNQTLYEQPEAEISNFSIYILDNIINFSCINNTNDHGSLDFYIADDKNVSDINYDLTVDNFYRLFNGEINGNLGIIDNKYEKGDTIYVVIYTRNSYDQIYIYDWSIYNYKYVTSKKVSEVLSVIY